MFIVVPHYGVMASTTTPASKPIRAAFPNKINAKCVSCKTDVPIGKGYSFKNPGWQTVCASTACAKKANVLLPSNERVMTKDGFVRTPKEPENLKLFRALPGARWNRDEMAWQFSLDMADRERVLEIGDELKLDIDPSLRKIKYSKFVTERVEFAKAAGPWGDFQIKGVEFMTKHERCFLADDMGLGKTWQALMAIPSKGRTILVVPSNVKYNWRDEAARFRPDIEIRVVTGRQKNVKDILPKVGEAVVINYEILPADLKPEPTGERSKYSGKEIKRAKLPESVKKTLSKVTVIADEAHRAKNYKAQRTQKLTELCRLADRVVGMSGTPLNNKPTDLWGTLSALDMAFKVFGSWSKFVQLFGGYDNGYGLEWPDYRTRPVPAEAAERLRRVMLRRTKAEVLPELPPKTYKTLVVNGLSKKIEKELNMLAEKWGELLDCGELPPFEAFSELRAKLAESRIPALLDIVSDYEDAEKPLVVFSAHRAPVDELAKREGWAVITGDTKGEDRQDVVRRFQAGELKGVALTIKAGCEGLTLTHASYMLFVDLDWVPTLNAQAEDRICRIGQTADKIVITRMVSDHALDLRVLELLAIKQAMIESAIEAKAKATQYDHAATGPAVTNESPEAMQARLDANNAAEAARLAAIEAAQREADEKAWQEKVDRIHARQLDRAAGDGYDLRSKTLTPVIVDALKRAYSYMLSVCDGAVEKDYMGFNKPDAMMARILMHHDLESEDTQYALWAILSRYHRQLGDSYPAIFMRQ